MDCVRWLTKLLMTTLLSPINTESPPKHEKVPEKELWTIKYEHNLNNSPIYRLPNELILMVMTQLPLESLYLFRQACHQFKIIFTRPEFARLHNSYYKHIRSWEVKALLQRDAFCQPCQVAIGTEDSGHSTRTRLQQTLYCGGCKRHHPMILFSVAQRWNTDEQRVCIGREGYIRLCQHKTLSWLNIEEVLNGGDRMLTLQCGHNSHRKSLWCQSVEDDLPSITIYPRTGYIVLSWRVTPLDINAEQLVTVRHIRHRLKTADLAATVSLCPHKSFDDITFLLQPFDPHNCACTQSQSIFPIVHTKTDRCEPTRPWYKRKCCFCQSIQLGGSKAGKLLATYDTNRSMLENWHDSPVGHDSYCQQCRTLYRWERVADLITLKRRTTALIQSPWDSDWIQLLDPTSYYLEEPDTCHKLWCNFPECATSRHWQTRKVLMTIANEAII